LFLEVRDKAPGKRPACRRSPADIAGSMSWPAWPNLPPAEIRPAVVDSSTLSRIKDGRHPVIEATQEEPFIPNDAYLDREDEQILIITGPNMGGKSTICARWRVDRHSGQMGSFVPAGEASIGMSIEFSRARGDGFPDRRPGHVHGRDARDRSQPQQRHSSELGSCWMRSAGGRDLRRMEHRLGGAEYLHENENVRAQDALRHPLP